MKDKELQHPIELMIHVQRNIIFVLHTHTHTLMGRQPSQQANGIQATKLVFL